MNEGEDVKYIDAENYQGGQRDQLTFREIVMRHIVKLSSLSSKEFCGGYWQERTKVIGGAGVTESFYVGDSREEYCNSIDFLHDILVCYFDEEMKKASQDNEKEIDKVYNDSFYKNEDDKKKLDKQHFRNKKVIIKRKLLQALSAFLMREKYLSAKQFEEEV